jgi:alpha-amylase
MCNLKRYKEPYHETVLKKAPSSANVSTKPLSIHEMLGSKEKDLDKHLFYDPYKRLSFMDHFFEEEIGVEEFRRSSYIEIGDFVGAPYALRSKRAFSKKELCFERKGHLLLHHQKRFLQLRKVVIPEGASSLKVSYNLKNESGTPLAFVFGVEFNFSIGDDTARKGLCEKGVKEWIFNDSWRGVRLKLISKGEATLLTASVETVSESESGLERVYQELAVLFQRPFQLDAGESKDYVLDLGVD